MQGPRRGYSTVIGYDDLGAHVHSALMLTLILALARSSCYHLAGFIGSHIVRAARAEVTVTRIKLSNHLLQATEANTSAPLTVSSPTSS